MKTVDQYNFAGKRALVRVDFNVPMNEAFEITDDTRIRAAVPTIKKILADGGSAILMSHLPDAYARDLYAALHDLDAEACDLIVADSPPDEPDWAGVRDRLRRAARG